MSYALLFAGQGTQHAAMLPWLEAESAAQPVLRDLAAHLGPDWRARLDDVEARSRNGFAQPLVVGTALAAWSALEALLDEPPVAVAGYSVGELAACAAAGVLPAGRALSLAAVRAELMDRAGRAHPGGLLAVTGIGEAEVLRAAPALACAIRIDPTQNIFGGTMAVLDRAERALAGRATCRRLEIRVASHTPAMRGAADAFADALAAETLAPATCPVATNASGRMESASAALTRDLALQIRQTVQWGDCLAAIAERSPACVLEIGAGQALARMWTARHPHVPARSLDDFRSAGGAAAWVARQRA